MSWRRAIACWPVHIKKGGMFCAEGNKARCAENKIAAVWIFIRGGFWGSAARQIK